MAVISSPTPAPKPEAVTALPPNEIALLQPVPATAIVETFPVKALDEIKVTERDPQDKVKREPKGGKQTYSPEALEKLKESERLSTAAAVVVPTAISNWMWPLTGSVKVPFLAGVYNGIDLTGKLGDAIVAVADGRVIYAGPGFHAYGKLIIIRHSPDYLSVYAHAAEERVVEGQAVTRGQKIAQLGGGESNLQKLHFEMHYQGKPVDPQKYLPPR